MPAVQIGDGPTMEQDLDNIKTLILALRGVLLDGFQSDENANCDSLESEELMSVASVIDKLSLSANNNVGDSDNDTDNVRDITDKAIRQTLEENEDLKRQNILLEQQLGEKERRIKALEKILLNDEKSFGFNKDRKFMVVNTASQVGNRFVKLLVLCNLHSKFVQ